VKRLGLDEHEENTKQNKSFEPAPRRSLSLEPFIYPLQHPKRHTSNRKVDECKPLGVGLTPFELEREERIARNKVRMAGTYTRPLSSST